MPFFRLSVGVALILGLAQWAAGDVDKEPYLLKTGQDGVQDTSFYINAVSNTELID